MQAGTRQLPLPQMYQDNPSSWEQLESDSLTQVK